MKVNSSFGWRSKSSLTVIFGDKLLFIILFSLVVPLAAGRGRQQPDSYIVLLLHIAMFSDSVFALAQTRIGDADETVGRVEEDGSG